MTLRGTRTVGTGARRTAVVTALALALTGAVGGAVATASAPAGEEALQGHTPDRDWLPQTPQNWPLVVDHTRTPAETVTRGLQHFSETYDTVGGRQHIQVLSADLDDPNLRIGMVQAGDTVTNPADETPSSMAHRTGAVAGVNGDYFEIHASGRPLGGIMTDGRLLKSPKPGFASQLGVKPDGTIVMGPQTFSGTITDGSATRALTSVNTVNDLTAGGITEVTPTSATPPACPRPPLWCSATSPTADSSSRRCGPASPPCRGSPRAGWVCSAPATAGSG